MSENSAISAVVPGQRNLEVNSLFRLTNYSIPVSYTHLDVYKRQNIHCYGMVTPIKKLKPSCVKLQYEAKYLSERNNTHLKGIGGGCRKRSAEISTIEIENPLTLENSRMSRGISQVPRL